MNSSELHRNKLPLKSSEVETRTQGSRVKPRTQKNPRPRPRTALPWTYTLEAKDRNVRGQGQGPRTQTQVFSKKIIFQNFFSGDLKKRRVQKKLFQPIYKILPIQKILLSSSWGQGNFRGLVTLESRPRTRSSRPKTSKCVLEDVFEDSTSENHVPAATLCLHLMSWTAAKWDGQIRNSTIHYFLHSKTLQMTPC